jgi:rhomboid protease GluP
LVSASILLAWAGVAVASGQTLTATQGSRLLLQFGACDGSVLRTHEWWRLVASQWLHALFPHMLFNAGVVAFGGALLERRVAWRLLWLAYVSGGALAQLASAWAYPDEVSSGASQAMLVLCGAALLSGWTRPLPSWASIALLVLTALQIALDLKAVGTVKVGHAVGLAIGLAAGVVLRLQARTKAAAAS